MTRQVQLDVSFQLRRTLKLSLCGFVMVTISLVTSSRMAFADAPPAAAEIRVADHHYCDGCTPPLVYGGGPVLAAGGSGSLTITPVFWAPTGWSHPFPSNYQPILDGYIHNLAVASGSSKDVLSVATQYYQSTNGAKDDVSYAIKAGQSITDTDPFPSGGCSPDSGYEACVDDAQLRTEVAHVVSSHGLPTGLGYFYPVFFPPGVETQDLDGSNSASGFCGYHRSFGMGSALLDYANMPYEADGCGDGQEPNGSYAADGAVSSFSHELTEAVTDPTAESWVDSSGNEIGDICADAYGAALGSTSSKHPDTTKYNQVINGGKYYTQEEFSNAAYSSRGFGNGCQQSKATVTGHSASPSSVATIFSDASPFMLAADGTTTTDDRVVIADKDGYAVVGDPVTFSEYVASGGGTCGPLSATQTKTDNDGVVDVTYTTSKANVVCYIVATDAFGGKSSQSIIYQGSTQSSAPTATADFPSSFVAGGSPKPFKLTVTNNSPEAITSARIDLVVFPYGSASPNLNASQVRITYSTDGSNGHFVNMKLTGSTVKHGGIDGAVGPRQGDILSAGQSETVYFTIALANGAPVAHNQPTMSLEGFLDQVDPATGSGTTLADTNATDVTATSS